VPDSRLASIPVVPIAAGAVVAMGASAVVALQDPLPDWELELTTAINELPDWLTHAAYPIMQLGTVGAPLVVGAVLYAWRRERVLGVSVAATGLATWFGAKAVKDVIRRGRPLQYLPDVIVREGAGTGLGYISGHAATVGATAVMVLPLVARRWWPLATATVGAVGVARIAHGVHLPADVVGGWAFGALMGLGGLAAADLVASRARRRA